MIEHIKIEDIVQIAKRAGDAIMQIYVKDFSVEFKDDKSPLTEADKKANNIIEDGLNALDKKIPILSEEGKMISYEERKEWEYFWMVDPLDGTKEFIKKNGEFTVNIALIHKNIPILGVVYAPALNEMYWAVEGQGAFKDGHKLPLTINQSPEKKLRIVASKSHLSTETQEYIDQLAQLTESIECVSKGSSLKLCMVAEGSADIYPRLAPTMEWDTAAADAIVRESGKMTYSYPTVEKVVYNKENLLNPWFVVKATL
ncbi:3'(2'),5'-bisphosphate nucleotidase CysQ [Sulfuricurvum sp.]|uniref:3'(2'),5'-bisphosphate nucleotidase CysQ n=1 Tax=Sulfuricurvum sp. TaxID=2025608 RepID=UPI002624AC2C|nr:3'(2'),5'-bisphosphate nucleotidase CysQ [Sulfuricurvum sp.]MDD4950722.1 3'(2'),5'-bisphosphate nucleotidase CysQ [Sulfuricurvum sp.]